MPSACARSRSTSTWSSGSVNSRSARANWKAGSWVARSMNAGSASCSAARFGAWMTSWTGEPRPDDVWMVAGWLTLTRAPGSVARACCRLFAISSWLRSRAPGSTRMTFPKPELTELDDPKPGDVIEMSASVSGTSRWMSATSSSM